jgi:hypothetical protein
MPLSKTKKTKTTILDIIQSGVDLTTRKNAKREEEVFSIPNETDLPDEVDNVNENMFPSAD